MTNDLKGIITTISRIKTTNNFAKYINFIRFPFYRNLDLDTLINFDFPLTVFIGQNGCGKSSCLHALYGMPQGKTPYEFWFDTKVDPITYYDDQKKRHSFWYSFKDERNIVREVIKARIQRSGDPNYWETSRPLAWAGMKTRRGTLRDKPIEKNVIYIDFRAELSAFDKYFYFGSIKGLRSRNKQDYIRYQSIHLKKIISGEEKIIHKSKGNYNKSAKDLNSEELKYISYILGKNYLSAKYIEHTFFRNEGFSVIFNANHAIYSEAFAGSGEVAVVSLVLKVLNAPEFSLILLDEPEVSLHPGAQVRLKMFLLEQIKLKKHQIIIASHSPSIVKGLPKEAIKVFYQNPSNGRFIVKENLTPEEAFYHIEFPIDSRKEIIVEDLLAKEILSELLSKMGDETKNLFHIKYNPGGETVIKKEFIPVFCREPNEKEFVFFDGDQKLLSSSYDWRSFPTSDLNIPFLQTKIKEQTNEEIKFSTDGGIGGGNQTQQLELLKMYLDFYLNNVFYLPKRIPEEIIWDEKLAEDQIKLVILNDEEIRKKLQLLREIINTKKKFAFITNLVLGDDNSENILSVHKIFIQRWLNAQNEDYETLKSTILEIINRD